MTKTAADRQARSEMSWYRQGIDWILVTWDEHYGCGVTSRPMTWWQLIAARVDYRERRIVELIAA